MTAKKYLAVYEPNLRDLMHAVKRVQGKMNLLIFLFLDNAKNVKRKKEIITKDNKRFCGIKEKKMIIRFMKEVIIIKEVE